MALTDIPERLEQRSGRETVMSSDSGAEEVDPEPPNDADEPADKLGSRGLHSATIQAIQVTAACGIAMALGYLISGQRWYWAVITAFIVFNGAGSRGDTILRGIQRLAGTVAGVIAGVLLATALSAHPYVEMALVLPCIFLAFYSFQVSYAAMIFWFTIALALLYGLMGLFSPELLLVRLEETGAGAVAGMIVAAWLFPQRTRSAVEDSLRGFLRTLDDLIKRSIDLISEAGNKGMPVALSRALDRSFKAAQDATGPVTFGWGVQASSLSARQLATLATCRYWARELAFIAGTSGRNIGAAHTDHIRRSAQDVRSRISRLQKQIERAGVSTGLRPVQDAEGGEVGRTPIVADPTAEQQGAAATLEVLGNLDAALERLAFLQRGGSPERGK
jgi:uncharacterized membrane protein YccC